MIIERVEIKNFRSIRETQMECENLTAILGRNGAGKSSFLHAIDYFYDIAAPLTEEDFFDRDTGSHIEIRVTYGNLRNDEKKEFKSYIREEKLIVTKRISLENDRFVQRYYAAALQIPEFAKIRALSGKRDRVSAWRELVDSEKLDGLSGSVRGADDVEELMAAYEVKHTELMKPVEREEQFFGAKSVGGGKLDKFTKYVLIPAVREASDEVGTKRGAVYQILDMIVFRKINARKDIQEFKSEFDERIKELYSSENLTELPELGKSISQTLKKFAPGSQLNLKWDEVKLPEVPLPSAMATLIEDRFEGEITRKGHGLQRALIVSLLQHLALTVPIEESEEDPVDGEAAMSESETVVSQWGPDLILAIEEPELYLHPSRCRYLAALLHQLTKQPEIGLGAGNQVIYTSHSPYFVDLHLFDQIRMIRKVQSPDSVVPQSVVSCFTLLEAASEMARITGGDPSKFTRDSFRARAMPVMNTIVNEGFFADTVVVVEGLSDVGALWKLQEIMKMDWSQLGIVVVPAGGKNNIDRPVVIFRGLSIPTFFIFDADSQLIGKRSGEKEAKSLNSRYLNLAGAPIEDFPETQVHDTWAVFRENLEGLFKEELGEDCFHTIKKDVASELGYDDLARVNKNIEGSARIVEIAYEKGHRIQTLEGIIEKVTQLRSSEE